MLPRPTIRNFLLFKGIVAFLKYLNIENKILKIYNKNMKAFQA